MWSECGFISSGSPWNNMDTAISRHPPTDSFISPPCLKCADAQRNTIFSGRHHSSLGILP